MNNGTDLSFLNAFAPSQGNWTGNTVNIPGLPSAHIGTDPLPVPFWGNVKPAPRTPAQIGGFGGGGAGSSQMAGGGADPLFALMGFNNGQSAAPAPTQNTVQMPTIGGYTLTADDLAALQTLPDILWPQTPPRAVNPTVTAQEGDQIPNNAPVYDSAPSYAPQPISYVPSAPVASPQPSVSAMEGAQIPNNAPVYDSSAYSGNPYQVQAPDIGWGGLTQADLASLRQTPTLPSDSSGPGFGSGLVDRLSSIGAAPNITGANVGQAAINAGGLFSPFIPIGAGLLQGFNQYDPGETTGNALADVAGTPGWLQTSAANISNFVDRMFGGTRMPSSYVDPTVMGPMPDGSPYSQPATTSTASPYSEFGGPFQGMVSGSGGGGGGGGYQSSYPNPSSFNLTGNMLNSFMQGAGWGGAGFGYGSSNYGYGQPDNNGGWGQ
jgi:hypothetical protein